MRTRLPTSAKGCLLGQCPRAREELGRVVETLLKDFADAALRALARQPTRTGGSIQNAYTIGEVAQRLRQFIFEEKAAVCETETNIQLRVCGYSAGRPLAEIWELQPDA